MDQGRSDIARGSRRPGYLQLSREDFLSRIEEARSLLSLCRLCPRKCGADRLAGELGFCRAPAEAQVSSYNSHPGEEPPLSGFNGSGTIFFTHCNLRCIFCQNYPISHLGNGRAASPGRLASMMMSLRSMGCHNINFVTPTHYAAQILEALLIARERGLDLPLVYNSSGYDSVEALKLLDGVVDIYLPDMKYNEPGPAKELSGAEDYPEVNRLAIKEMHRQVGALEVDEDGIAVKGLIIRHLVLPGDLSGSEGVLRFIREELGKDVTVSLMSQYFPAHRAFEHPLLKNAPSLEEYNKAYEFMKNIGLSARMAQYY